tara:strand:+ start:941 stop:1102 length:162 start_codon:yes stop_codon:yes gene_type:complete
MGSIVILKEIFGTAQPVGYPLTPYEYDTPATGHGERGIVTEHGGVPAPVGHPN